MIISRLALSAATLLAFLSIVATSASPTDEDQHHRRIKVSKDKNVATELKAAHKKGKKKNHFLLSSEVAGETATFDVAVKEPAQAVTEQTTTSVNGGRPKKIAVKIPTVLVSDEAGVVALLAVDEDSENMNGIIHDTKKGKSHKTKMTQKKGKKVRSAT